jgi:predicted RNase H-like HicB family nuclease
MKNDKFVFSNAVFKEDKGYSSLCLDLDVASQGDTVAEAKKHLLEAIDLYLETAIESNLPYMRPVPSAEDPRRSKMPHCVEIYDLKVAFSIKAHA